MPDQNEPSPALRIRARALLLVLIAGVWLIAPSLSASDSPPDKTTNAVAKPRDIPGVHNALQATANFYSGSQPEGGEAFAAIAKLGIKTIVSVDGGKPDVEAARKHGLRYVHLPFGYDGVPTNRIAELTKLTAEGNGPFFVHCHHGKHRGPAAVAVMCLASGDWTTNVAVAWLREAGTSPDYPGLYQAATTFSAPTKSQLAAITKLPEVAPTSSLVDAMVAIDAHFDHLKLSQKAGWKTPPGHADISPTHEATMLWEQFKEMARTEHTAKQPADYRAKLAQGEQATDSLRKLLREPSDFATIDVVFKKAGQNCVACHKQYRNE